MGSRLMGSIWVLGLSCLTRILLKGVQIGDVMVSTGDLYHKMFFQPDKVIFCGVSKYVLTMISG